jgi:N-acetylglutamate synthase-like GNAT family acetyltransferase
MQSYSLDTSCVLNLLNPDEPIDDALVKLLRLGLLGVVHLFVTDACPKEVAAAQAGRRAEIAKRASMLPVLELAAERTLDRDRLAQQFFSQLWPNSSGTSKMADHGRRDCEHLASHVLSDAAAFVTRDVRLLDKVRAKAPHPRLVVLSAAEALQKAEASQPKPLSFATRSFGVRRATTNDRDAIKALLDPVRRDYHDFDGWLRATLDDPRTIVNLGVVNGATIEGAAIWKPKDDRTAKLSTFYMRPEARKLGLGQHLLFHCLRQWVEKKVERAYVTASATHEDIISFCLAFGFRIEGAAQRRYASGDTELVLTKHLMYERVTDDAIPAWLERTASTVFSVHPNTPSCASKNWFIPPAHAARKATWNEDERAMVLADEGGAGLQVLGIREVEDLFYPIRFPLAGRSAYVVPIQPQWADRMMDMPRRQEALFRVADKLMLRIDNAYYCAPVYADDDLEGAPIIFYVSSPTSALTGIARVITRVVAEPEDLFLRFGQLGIYSLEEIRRHVATRGSQAGSAMAMHFGWWLPFAQPLALERLSDFGMKGHPQRTLRIGYDQFEAMMRAGGIEW